MAPKAKAQAPAVSPASISEGLSSLEQPARHAAVNNLLELTGREADLVRHGVPTKLLQILAGQDRTAQAAAAKALAKYASTKGAVYNATATPDTWDGLWAVLEEHLAVLNDTHLHSTSSATSVGLHGTSTAGGSTSPQRGTAAAGRKPAVAAVKEDEEVGPSKLVLEPVLRALASHASASKEAAAALCQRPAQPLFALLPHPSPRVQMRAQRLLLVLLHSQEMHAAVLAGGAAPLLIKCLKSTSSAVQVSSLRVLHRLALDCSPCLVQLQQYGLLDVLLAVLSEPAVPVAALPAAAGAKAKAAAAQTAADASKQAAKAELQYATCTLLAQLCSSSPAFCEQFVASDGLQLLHQLLPDCPEEKAEDVGASDADGAIAAPGGMDVPAAPSSNCSTQQPTGMRPGSAVSQRPGSAVQHAAPEKQPPAKVSEPRVHAKLLDVLATLAGHPAGSAALLAQQESGAVPWAREVLHAFAAAPFAAPAPGTEGGPDASAAAAGGAAVKGKVSVPPTPKADKKGAVLEAAAAPVYEPPYAACVKVSALRCIAQLCMQPAHAAALEAQSAMVSQMLGDLRQMQPEQLATVVEDAARLMHVMAEGHLQGQPQDVLVELLKVLAVHAESPEARCLLARAVVALPEELFVAPPRPPLPSPPPTPPPPPLPTNQFAWDALGRPMVTDGMTLQAVQ